MDELPDHEILINEDGSQTVRYFTLEELEAKRVWLRKSQVPEKVTARQVRLLLLQQGLLDEVEAMIKQQDRATQIAWEWADEFRRDAPLLLALAANLGLTDEVLDNFFIAAAAL